MVRNQSLLSMLRTSFLGDSKLYHYLRYHNSKKQRDKYIRTFIGDSVSDEERKRLYHGMREAWVKYRWNFEEFFLFRYEHISDDERKAFVSEYEKNVFSDRVNESAQASILHSKVETYNAFKKYFGRDVVFVNSGAQLLEHKDFLAFVESHNSFIMKPIKSSCGIGIKMVRATSKAEALDIALRSISKDTDYLIEELIEQVEEMSEFHPQSVNTVRIPTFKAKDGVHILHPFMRTGCGNSFVDNAGSGGVFAVIDPETGKTVAACDEKGKDFSHHPDSGKSLIGFTIPRWEEAVTLAKEMAMVLPDVHYTGWDLALTKNGWVMVEGNNRGQFVWQYALHRGCRPEFEKIYKLMK